MNEYEQLKEKFSQEVNEFPFFSAFNNQQLEDGMKSLGLNPDETDKLESLGSGGFIRKTDLPTWKDMANKHKQELEAKIYGDKDGSGFIKDMFLTEMANYEYGYTQELNRIFEALGLTVEIVNGDKQLLNGLRMAIKDYGDNIENVIGMR